MVGMHLLKRVRAFIFLLALSVLVACGYTTGNSGPVALPEAERSLYIQEVTNPTMETWLGPRLRSLLRDELHRRGWTVWADKADADAWVKLEIHRFSHDTDVMGEQEETIRSSSNISTTMRIYSRSSGEMIWTSNEMNVSESFFGSSTSEADDEVTQLLVRRMVDLLSQAY